MIKSPFLVFQNFLSPKQCEELISQYEVKTPNLNRDGNPIKLEKIMSVDKGQNLIMQKLRDKIDLIEEHYDAEYRGTAPLVMQHYPEYQKAPAELPGCENSSYLKRKWIKTKDVDLVGFLWLKEYHEEVPLDPGFEVYGGKLELPAYNFSLVPQRGSLVLFPAFPHFITCISPILVGDLYQIKINIALSKKDGGIWLYNPTEYPSGKEGFLMSWFKDYL